MVISLPLGAFFTGGFVGCGFSSSNLILIGFFRPERGVPASVRESPYLQAQIVSHGRAGGSGYWSGSGSGPAVSRTRGRSSPPAEASSRSYDRTGGLPQVLHGQEVRGTGFMDFFMDLRPPGRFGCFPCFGFHDRAPHNMFGNIPSCRADLRLCQRFHGAFHGNLHGRLDFRFFHGRDVITGCRGYLPFRLSQQREPFLRGFHYLPDLGTPRRGNRLLFRDGSSSGALVNEISRFTGGCFSRSLTGFFVGLSSWFFTGSLSRAGCLFRFRFCRFFGNRTLWPGRWLIFFVEKGNPLINLGRPVHPVLDKNNFHCLDLIIGRADG